MVYRNVEFYEFTEPTNEIELTFRSVHVYNFFYPKIVYCEERGVFYFSVHNNELLISLLNEYPDVVLTYEETSKRYTNTVEGYIGRIKKEVTIFGTARRVEERNELTQALFRLRITFSESEIDNDILKEYSIYRVDIEDLSSSNSYRIIHY